MSIYRLTPWDFTAELTILGGGRARYAVVRSLRRIEESRHATEQIVVRRRAHCRRRPRNTSRRANVGMAPRGTGGIRTDAIGSVVLAPRHR